MPFFFLLCVEVEG